MCFIRAAVVALALACVSGTGSTAQETGVSTMDVATLRNIGRPSISPSGRYIAYQVYQAVPQTNSYRNEWILADASTGRSRVLVASGGSPILTYEDNTVEVTDYEDDWASFPAVWASDETLYYVRRDNGATNLRRLTLAGSDTLVRGIYGTIVFVRQTNAGHALVTTLASTSATVAASKKALRSGMLFFGSSSASDIDPFRGVPDLRPKKLPHYFDVDLRTGTVRPESSSQAFTLASYVPLKAIPNMIAGLDYTLSPDGRKRVFMAVIRYHGGYSLPLFTTSPTGADLAELVPPVAGSPTHSVIDSIEWSPDSKTVFFTRETGYVNTDFFSVDVASTRVRQITNAHTYFDHCWYTADVHFATCTMETSLHPANIARVDLVTGEVRVLSDLNPEFDRKAHGIRAQVLVWTNSWGDVFFGQLVYPRAYRSGVRYPIVVLSYGASGFQRGGSGDENPIVPLAENGFFVLNVDTSGSSGHREAGLDKAGVLSLATWQSPLDAITQMVRHLQSAGLVNEQVGISGLSYGTELSMYSATHSKIFRAAIDSNGGSARDPVFYYLKNKLWDGMFRDWGLNGPPYGKNLANWQSLSPALRASQTNAAFLMNAADCSYLIGLQQYWELKDHHKPVEMWVYPQEEHTKYQPAHRLTIYNRNIDWYRFWLQGYEDRSPAKSDQYTRWRAMRADWQTNDPSAKDLPEPSPPPNR